MASPLSYYVLFLRYADGSDEAIVNPAHDWQDIVDRVRDACGENQPVTRVDHIRDGRAFDRTQDACWAVCHELASECEPLTNQQWEWIETHCGPQAASAFARAA